MIFIWTGATDGVWATAANWKDETGAAVATTPGAVAGRLDDAYFNDVPTTAVAGSVLAQALRSLSITSGYTADFASSGTYLQANISEVNIDCAGDVYLDGGANPGLASCLCSASASGKTIYLKGYVGTLTVLDATVQVDAGSINTALTIGVSSSSTAALTLVSGVTAVPGTIAMNGGAVTNGEAVTTLNIAGGTWTQTTGNITTLTIYDGTFNWDGGNITTMTLYGGTVGITDADIDRRVVTVNLYEGGTLDLSNSLRHAHVTGYINQYGGALSLADAYKIEEYRAPTFAGTADVVQGMAPVSVAENDSHDSTELYVASYDRLDCYVSVGATDVVTTTAQMYNATVAGGGYAAITDPAAITFAAADGNKTKKLTLWGYQCAATKSSVLCRITTSADGAGHAALVSVVMVKYSTL
jgi:hypothetical protein